MIEKLTQIFNTLGMIETKGNNTLIMAECLRALQSVIQEAAQETEAPAVETEEE